MKNVYYFNDFIKEAKQSDPLTLFKKDVQNIIDDMFYKAKKPKFEYDDDGYPISVEFEVVYNDWFCKYDEELKNEYTEGVLKKREYEPILIFVSKKQEGDDKNVDNNKYFIKFKIKKVKVDKEALKREEELKKSDRFEKESDEKLLKMLRSKRVSDANKERIMDILKDRGVDYRNPFEEEDEYELSEEEMIRRAEKEAKKLTKKYSKNESFIYNNMFDELYLLANDSESFEDFKNMVEMEYPHYIEENEDFEEYLLDIYKKSVEDRNLVENKKECGCGVNKLKKCKKCGEEECECEKDYKNVDDDELDDDSNNSKCKCGEVNEKLKIKKFRL